MIYRPDEFVDIETPTGPMRTHLFRPVSDQPVPAIILFSEIYQVTEPIRRAAQFLAGHGFLVAAPEVYHEFEPACTALAYDPSGTDRGNALKTTKTIAAFDADAGALVRFLQGHPGCTGKLGALGICLGGHLSFRACVTERALTAGVCFYGTDLHQRSLGAGKNDDTLARCAEIEAEMLMIWGRQDPHIPREGRRRIQDAMDDAGLTYSWHEFNGQHAFMRDIGHRHDPQIARQVWSLTTDFFDRILR